MTSTPNIPPAEAAALIQGELHRGRSAFQADLWVVDWRGRAAVYKDFSRRPAPIRATWGRIVAGRETRALEALGGMEGLPRLLARVGKSGFIMERIEARRLPKDDDPPPPPIYFERAEALIGAMHERGVAHGDLRRKNLFIDDGARPWVIDFGTAVVREAGLAGAVSRFLFERVALADRLKLARLQGEYLPDSLSDEQRRAIARTPFYFRLGQWFRHRIVRPLKPRRRRRLWRRLRRRLKSKSR